MDKNYKPDDIETKYYRFWEENGYFQPQGNGPTFSMVIPPPNVTGKLHMGHALNHTLQDVIARYKRLTGHQVLWLPGTDHAGIATQNVVEKRLKADKISRFDLGREKFVERVWEWKEEYANHITGQVRRLGDSVDWSRERFTMDEVCHDAVMEHFVKLYNDGLIYRGRYIINWCPRCETALSDIEVIHEDCSGHLWVIQYPLSDDASQHITIATTRPETMFGDTAIAVHPDDDRYTNLIGKTVQIPLTDTHIPIIADTHVDWQFGTGAVKVTPAHDLNDFEMGQRHNLEQVLIMTEKAIMNDKVPSQYVGLTREDCRKKLIQELTENGFLTETRDHMLAKGTCYRCQTVIEPYLSNQWFVAMKKLAEPAIDAVRNGDIKFIPKRWEKLYFEWMDNIRDWCISRQIWWGHRIPVWHSPEGDMFCAKTEAEAHKMAEEKYGKPTELKQDNDVLDTWFSSALWPFETLGWPKKTEDLTHFYPTTFLVTGYDIITFWVSRMITMGLYQTGKAPFSDVYIHGLVRDITGKKMSKSLGNAMDPLDLIAEYGADALRFSLASAATLGGQDIKFSTERCESARNFANKLWNSTRYIMMVLENYDGTIDVTAPVNPTTLSEKWILSEYESMLKAVNTAFDTYNYALSCDLIWDFTWNKFCDWYIEISKMDKPAATPILVNLLVHIIKLLHPTMPFITEDLYQKLKDHPKIDGLTQNALIIESWPASVDAHINTQMESQMEFVIKTIREIRNTRKTLSVPPSKTINAILISTAAERDALESGNAYIKTLAKVEGLTITGALTEKPKQCASSVVQNTEILIPLEGLIDISVEKQRIEKRLATVDNDLNGVTQKLGNENFLSKAPAQVIEKFKTQQTDLSSEKKLLEKQLANLG